MMQEMIKRGVLFQGYFLPCFSHCESDVDLFLSAFAASLDVLKKALDQGVGHFLVGEPIKPVFRKYN